MKIVQINTVCGTGSTGKITVALYELSKHYNYEPLIAYGRGDSPEHINGFKIGNKIDFYEHVLTNFFQGKSGFGSKRVTEKFLQWLDTVQPDILHLHNLHGFYINIEMLFDYIKRHNISVLWTFHDCWPITGQCAYFDYANCSKWKTGCYKCPIYRTSYPYSLFKDNSKENYILKKEIFNNIENMIIVTPSNWLTNIVKESFLGKYPVKTIYNGIDLNTFKPMCQTATQPKILLGVANVWTPQKGFSYFFKLAGMMDDSFQLVLIGVSKKQQKMLEKKYPNKIIGITRTNNQEELVLWYSKAYAFINPTLEDNFPTTNIEALACGTPVITFNTGGSPESINSSCGIVVEKGNVQQLKEAILSLENNTEITSHSCFHQALNFDKNIKFPEYMKLYEDLSHN